MVPREWPPSREMRNLRPLAARLAGDRWSRQLRLARFHDEGVLERIPRPLDLLVLVAHVVADEMAGDAELHVAVDEFVVLDVELRDQSLEPLLAGKEMKMRGAHIVPALRAQEVAGRPVDGDRIARGLDAAKADAALRVGEKFAAQVHVGLHGVLVLIKTFGR